MQDQKNQPEEKEVEQPAETPTEMSPEEIKRMRAQRSNFYNEQLKYLKPERDYHEMLAQIEECKTRQVKARFTQAQIFAAMQEGVGPKGTETALPKKQHTVTQEDLDANPDMVEQDIKVGDVIQVPLDYQTATKGAPTEDEGQE